MSTLAAIRAKLQAQENRSQQNQERSQADNAIYAHWNMAEGTSATIRFLPDGDSSNSFFWRERNLIKLPFAGVVGGDSKEVTVQVPCMEMYEENCPILTEVRDWFKDKNLEEMGRKYWKKKSYIFQGFVRQNPISDDKTPENPIRRFVISPQIFAIIKASLMDPEIEELPTDYMRGLDFRIIKASKGGYADYSTSGWARKESALTEVEAAAIEAHGLYNLKDFLPKKPSDAEKRIIREMFDASVAGRPYDPDRWGAYYKPWGLQIAGARQADSEDLPRPAPAPAAVKPAAAPTASTPPWEDDEPVQAPAARPAAPAPAPAATSDKAQDILAMIRSRQTKAA